MNSFRFYNPTRVIFGPGEMNKLGAEAARYGRRALLVKTLGPLEKLGVYARAAKLMTDAGMEVFALEGVEPNPKLRHVEEGARICREKRIDIVVAVGGGSAIDCAKAVAFAALDKGDIWDFFLLKRMPQASLPIGVVSTIAATGSEMNTGSVVTNERTQQKYCVHSELSFPKFAIIDPELHVTLPPYMTACGMVDTISHVLEGYFDGYYEDAPLQDRLTEGIVQTVLESEGVLTDPANINHRSNLAWAATLAINGLNDVGRGGRMWLAHLIEHEVSAKYDITHGAGLAAIHPVYLDYLCRKNPKKFGRFAARIFGIERTGRSDLELGLAGIEALRAKFKEWGVPVTLKEQGVERRMLGRLAEDITRNPEIISPVESRDMLEILESCFDS